MLLRLVLVVAVLRSTHGGIMMDPGVPSDPITVKAGSKISPEQQKLLDGMCALKCNVEKCYLKDEQECANYIMCERGAKVDTYRGTVLPCAFGTYWAGLALQQKMTCDLPQNVVCNIKKCDGMPLGYKFSYEWNCRGYWECGSKGPVPRCCSDDMNFDSNIGDCIPTTLENPCYDRCPIKTDACFAIGTPTAPFPDGNCRTYWDCEDLRPHPVCCSESQAYNDITKACEPSECTDTCPPEYKPDICQKQNTYQLLDNYCRTYMKCNAIQGDERWCCKPGEYYDPMDNVCKPKPEGAMLNCSDECPQGYNFECHLMPLPNQPSKYIETVHNVPLERECAPGSSFSEEACGCGIIVKGAPDNSCNMELDILFDRPTWIRSGSQMNTAIDEIGMPKPGKVLNNRVTTQFDGNLYYRANFFQQSMPKLFIHLIYLPGFVGMGAKQTLVSNCAILEGGTPSLELALQDSRIVLTLVAASQTNPNPNNEPVTVSAAYTPDDWNIVTALYDGETVSIFNQGSVESDFQSRPLSGEIKVAVEGLDFGGCMNSAAMFRGALAKLQISKCLKQMWIDDFNAATAQFQAP